MAWQQPSPTPPPKLPPKPPRNFVPRFNGREVVASNSSSASDAVAPASASFPTSYRFWNANDPPTYSKVVLPEYLPRPPGPGHHEDRTWANASTLPLGAKLPLQFKTVFVQRGDVDDSTRMDYETRLKNLGATVVTGDVSEIPRCVPGCFILVFPQTRPLIRRYFVPGRKYIVEEKEFLTLDKFQRVRNAWKDSVLEIERELNVKIPTRHDAVSLADAGCEALVAKYARIDDPMAETKRLQIPQDAYIGENRFFLRHSYHQVVDAVPWLEDIEERYHNRMNADYVNPAFEVVGRWVPMSAESNSLSTRCTPDTATQPCFSIPSPRQPTVTHLTPTTPTPPPAPAAPAVAHTAAPPILTLGRPGPAPSPSTTSEIALTPSAHDTTAPQSLLPNYAPQSLLPNYNSSSPSSHSRTSPVDMDHSPSATSLTGLAPPPLPMHDQPSSPVHVTSEPKGDTLSPSEAASSTVQRVSQLNSVVALTTLPRNDALPQGSDIEVDVEPANETALAGVAPQHDMSQQHSTIAMESALEKGSVGESRSPALYSSLLSTTVETTCGKTPTFPAAAPTQALNTSPSAAAAAAGFSREAGIFFDTTRGGPLKLFLVGCGHGLSISLQACGGVIVTDTADRPDAIIVALKTGEILHSHSLPRFGGFIQPQIIDVAWVHQCIHEDQLVDYTPYLLQRLPRQPPPLPLPFSLPAPYEFSPAAATPGDPIVTAPPPRHPSGDDVGLKRKTSAEFADSHTKRPRRNDKSDTDTGGNNLRLVLGEPSHPAPPELPGGKDDEKDDVRDPLDCISEGESELSDSPPGEQQIAEPNWIRPQHRQACLDLLHDIEQSGKPFVECWPDFKTRSYGSMGKRISGKTVRAHYMDYFNRRLASMVTTPKVTTLLANDVPEPAWKSEHHRLPTLAMVDALLAIKEPRAESFRKWTEHKFGPVDTALAGTYITSRYLSYINKRVPHRLELFNKK